MSYDVMKRALTGNEDNVIDLDDTLARTKTEKDRLLELKQGITNTIFEPAIDVMTGYIKARQDYLNATDIGYSQPWHSIQDSWYEWRSPVTHTYNTTLCASEHYGKYNTNSGELSSWRIEKWAKYADDEEGAATGYVYAQQQYTTTYESYADISHTKLAEVTGAPYNLDPTKHSLANLTHAVTSFNTGMVWIWATTDPNDPGTSSYGYSPTSSNPHHGNYNSWGINQLLDDMTVAIISIETSIEFHTALKSLNSRY